MTFNRTDRMVSDAVIYDGRLLKKKDTTERPPGQIWIFAAHESPVAYDDPKGSMWKNGTWRNSFNWTMTYNRWNTDIHLPYGRLRKKIFPTSRNYSFVASMKTDGALMISSDCDTHSKRHEYALELGKYIPVTILGSCGTTWECGQQFVHDDCFDVLNTTFKYYLAFPNAFCTQYFTEKFFDNYNYDIIFIVRGGKRAIEAHKMFPKGTFISAQDFTSAKSLGLYLRRLGESNNKLAQMLATKDIYYSPGYAEVYQNALCDICKRMNFQKRYRKQIKDIELWALGKEPCRVDD
ncbi:Alpha-(1 3)-fucosyltransferase 7 [Mactra antiquata]